MNIATPIKNTCWLMIALNVFYPEMRYEKTLMPIAALMLRSMTWLFTVKNFNAVGGNYRSFLRTRLPFFWSWMHSMQRAKEKRFSSPLCILISRPSPWMWVMSYVLSATGDLSADGNVTRSSSLHPLSKRRKLTLG